MKFISIFFLFIFSFNVLTSSDHEVGVTVGSFSGMGLTYSYELDANWRFTFTGFPYYGGEQIPDKSEFYLNVSGQIERNLFQKVKFKTYLFYNYSYWHISKNDYTERVINDQIIRTELNERSRIINHSIGLGYSRYLKKKWSISFQLALQSQISNALDEAFLINQSNNSDLNFHPAASISVRYLIK